MLCHDFHLYVVSEKQHTIYDDLVY